MKSMNRDLSCAAFISMASWNVIIGVLRTLRGILITLDSTDNVESSLKSRSLWLPPNRHHTLPVPGDSTLFCKMWSRSHFSSRQGLLIGWAWHAMGSLRRALDTCVVPKLPYGVPPDYFAELSKIRVVRGQGISFNHTVMIMWNESIENFKWKHEFIPFVLGMS